MISLFKQTYGLRLGFLLVCALCTTHIGAQSCVGDSAVINWYYYNDLGGSDLEDLYIYPFYPQVPSGFLTLGAVQTPSSFNDDFGSLIRGYIRVPETGMYQFNVTGDDETAFYLSTDTLPSNLVLKSNIPNWTNEDEHDKYPEQTSDSVSLVADEYYYFELRNKEGGGGDHATLWWYTPFYGDTVWRVVHKTYVYDYACAQTCDPLGTPCDDGDSTTVEDQYDGYCNCVGLPQNSSQCIGERGEMMVLYFDSISGSSLTDLYAAADYPLAPDRATVLNASTTERNTGDEYGSLLKFFLTVPADGLYQFNVTADDNTKLFLSTDEDPLNLTEVASVPGHCWVTNHTKYPEQTSDSIALLAGQFYYMELHHKEGGGGDHFNIFWRTPNQSDSLWRLLPPNLFFSYECEAACIPQGTPCDDEDDYTFNDQYDANCACVGTACPPGEPCGSEGYNPNPYQEIDLCDVTDEHSTNEEDMWESCTPAPNPNPARGISHWIQYDFNELYILNTSHIWNYNASGNLGNGFKEVVIDYSEDGVNWVELGTYLWDQANGQGDYTGFMGPDFNGVVARYVLITALSTHDPNASCAGFSELILDAMTCPNAGVPCDDGDPTTLNDTYDLHCQCNGEPAAINDCVDIDLILSANPHETGRYSAIETITSTAYVEEGSKVTYVAGTSITLNGGFEVALGGTFYAYIDPCGNSSDAQQTTLLMIHQHPLKKNATIEVQLADDAVVSLYVTDQQGNIATSFMDSLQMGQGVFKKMLPTHSMLPGIYQVVLRTEFDVLMERLVIVGN